MGTYQPCVHSHDGEEHPVPEHAGKDVLPLDLSHVEEVEHLAQKERSEDHDAILHLTGAEDVAATVVEPQHRGHLV